MSDTMKYKSDALAGKHVVAVGGLTGMGLGVANLAADLGADVTTASRKNSSAGGQHVRLDLARESSIREAFSNLAKVDHLVITAAPDVGSWGAPPDYDLSSEATYVQGKLMGSWACARYALQKMGEGSSITFVSGGLAAKPKSGFAPVSVAFAGLEALSRCLAVEYAPVRVNCIRAGFVDTEMWSFLTEEQRDGLKEKIKSNFPARRVGTVHDIADAAVFLMNNRYTTGATIEVTGGETLVDAV